MEYKESELKRMEDRRVVVTGMGVITSLGSSVESFWSSLMLGNSGVKRISGFDTSEFSTKIAAEVQDFDPTDVIEKKEARKMDRFTQFAVVAAHRAVEHAGLDLAEEDPDQIGVYIGSGIGGIGTFEEQHRIFMERGAKRVSPHFIPMLISNMASGQVSIHLGVMGPNSSPVSACATGTHAVGDAMRIIQRKEAEVMIAGGAEATITPLGIAAFNSAKAMSTRNDVPEKASRPFDRERDGFVMGEGAGILVLESLEHALRRGAVIYAEVVGYGMSGDAYHVTAPHPQGSGAMRSMQRALKDAGMAPEEIHYINAHGTSTPYNDQVETLSIKRTFGDYAYKLPVSSTKSMTGHLLGAAGGVEAIASILAIYHQTLPPTINYEVPDPECDLDYVPNEPREAAIETALSNSLGFGGHNATIIFKKYNG